jgi:hypothetical protein
MIYSLHVGQQWKNSGGQSETKIAIQTAVQVVSAAL